MSITVNTLKNAYDRFSAEHFGFVPIYKLRDALKNPNGFDEMLLELNQRDEPIIDLMGGNPRAYTPEQITKSIGYINLFGEKRLVLRIKWRS